MKNNVHQQELVSLDQGSGGLASQELISGIFLKHLKNPQLRQLEDCAVLTPLTGGIAFSTDSYVVDPLVFPGGDIGKLAVHGTINDLAMRGAKPLALSLALIIEEGFSLALLEAIIASTAAASEAAAVAVITGDTKVVPRGKADKLFINTSGIGVVADGVRVSGAGAKPGDAIIISGSLADHGLTIMSCQAGLSLSGDLQSDTQALHRLVAALLAQRPEAIHVLRDPTRGGLATTLCEIARSSQVGLRIEEERLPIRPAVATGCELLGLDPLYLANEGKCILFCDPAEEARLLALMRSMPEGRDAALIGRVIAEHPGRVSLLTAIGGARLVEPLSGQPLPRIC